MGGDAPSLDNAPLAFGLVIAAGLSTALGAAFVFDRRHVKLNVKPVLAAGLGFSGGVMLYVSFVEIFVKSNQSFAAEMEEKVAYLVATLCLFGGMLLLRLISMLVHMLDKDHHAGCDTEIVDSSRDEPRQAVVDIDGGEGGVVPKPAAGDGKQAEVKAEPKDRDLQKMGINTAAAIAIHNFPEGLATFVATLAEPTVGITLAIAIGIHNIPEGLCVALPIYYATDSRWKGFFWALLSGISEPVGALIGWLIIKSTGDDMNQTVYGILFGIVAGMMIMIVVLELLPTAYRYDPKDRVVTTSVVVGMLVMAASLVIFQF